MSICLFCTNIGTMWFLLIFCTEVLTTMFLEEQIFIHVLLCRYDFPWTPTKYIPFYGGAEYHDYHHYVGGLSQSNFASVFTYCDYIYGTDKVKCHLFVPVLLCNDFIWWNDLAIMNSLTLDQFWQGYRYQKKILKKVMIQCLLFFPCIIKKLYNGLLVVWHTGNHVSKLM